MPLTFLSLNYHVVFSTKDRVPLITPEWAPRLHEYLGGTINGLGGASMGVGEVADHVHLLFGLKAKHCLADVMRELNGPRPSGSMKRWGIAASCGRRGIPRLP